MEQSSWPPPWLNDLLPPAARNFLDQGGWWVVYGVAALLVLIVLLILVGLVRRLFGRRPAPDLDVGLREDLAGYPPPPGAPPARRLLVEGHPARVRLVVIAPVGKQVQVDPANAEPLLEHVRRGLGAAAQHDRPRVRVWPPQLSHQGFAVKFHRLTATPDQEGRPSHWALLAGRARVGQHYLLLGLALWTDETTTLGRLTLEPDQWPLVLNVRKEES
jgi:hypothetical protein